MSALNNSQIAELLGIAPPEITEMVDAAINQTLATLEYKLGLPMVKPKVVYDLKGTTAGEAWGAEKIRLNLKALLNEETRDYMLYQTVPHEVAHIVEFQLYGQAGHGYRWKHLMYLLGLPANRTHNLPLPKARKHQTYIWYCLCGPKYLKTTRHKRALAGTLYACPNCGELLQREPVNEPR